MASKDKTPNTPRTRKPKAGNPENPPILPQSEGTATAGKATGGSPRKPPKGTQNTAGATSRRTKRKESKVGNPENPPVPPQLEGTATAGKASRRTKRKESTEPKTGTTEVPPTAHPETTGTTPPTPEAEPSPASLPIAIKRLVDHADTPEKWKADGGKAPARRQPKATSGRTSTAKAQGGDTDNVVSFEDKKAARLDFEAQIETAEDFENLVYGLAVQVHGSTLPKPTRETLFKRIAKRAGISLDTLKKQLPPDTDGTLGRGRGNPNFLPYEIVGNQIFAFEDQGRRPLCNFVAKIKEEIVFDDGQEQDTLFRIEGFLSDGTPLPAVEVTSAKFAGLSWVTAQWGARALVHAGSMVKDHLRTAIQALSTDIKRRTIYGHTGWRNIGGQWTYLHGGGAISADGNRAEFEVRAGEGHMRRYAFAADGGGDLAADVRASLRLLDISASNPALGVVLLAAVYRAPLGEAVAIDHGLFLAGQTGSRKSEAAALALAHFGRGFNSRHFPANWDDSESDLEGKGHAAKDAVFVVDDFKPRGAPADVHKLHVKGDRLFRSVGNQSGRGRRTADMKQRAAYHPRGFVLATGEDIPRGASLRARIAVVELTLTDVDNAVLSELQTSAREGALERAMAGYLRWLASEMDQWKSSLPAIQRAFRDTALSEGFAQSHPRAADIYASLLIGLDLFFQFSESVGAADTAARQVFFERAESTLKAVVSGQSDLQEDQDEVSQFIRLLRSCLNKGACHLSDSLHQGAPAEKPHFWGWRSIPGTEESRPQGQRIGWLDAVRVYLDGEATLEAVSTLARAKGENLTITSRTIWKRLHEGGKLLDVAKEGNRLRLSPKRKMGGVWQWVYVMDRKEFEEIN